MQQTGNALRHGVHFRLLLSFLIKQSVQSGVDGGAQVRNAFGPLARLPGRPSRCLGFEANPCTRVGGFYVVAGWLRTAVSSKVEVNYR